MRVEDWRRKRFTNLEGTTIHERDIARAVEQAGTVRGCAQTSRCSHVCGLPTPPSHPFSLHLGLTQAHSSVSWTTKGGDAEREIEWVTLHRGWIPLGSTWCLLLSACAHVPESRLVAVCAWRHSLWLLWVSDYGCDAASCRRRRRRSRTARVELCRLFSPPSSSQRHWRQESSEADEKLDVNEILSLTDPCGVRRMRGR